MVQIIEVIYSSEVLKPLNELTLNEEQRVRVIIESADTVSDDRGSVLARLRAGIADMKFRSTGPLPTREQLHDRV